MQIEISKNSAVVTVEFREKGSKKTPYGFEGKLGQIVLDGKRVIVGTADVKTTDDWRVIGVKLVAFLKSIKVKSASIEVPEHCAEFVEGLQLGAYEFTKYKSKPEKSRLEKIYLTSKSDITETVNKAIIKADATCYARDWVNTTPEDANSHTLESEIHNLFKHTAIKVTVYGEKDLKNFGMNAHLAVNRASRHDAKTIKLECIPETYDKHHVFVGKGLMYDSGGLSIKPSNSMTTMKADKAGAMAALGAMKALAELGCPHKVTMYLGIAENMIDGSAYKPDDVLTAMNGTTIHVKNTDAEGRLVLFDNLCLAQKENDDITTIHTLATLTGAAVFQFGDEAAGLVGFNEKLKSKVKKAGDKAGEVFMNAEFHRFMMDGIKDDLADISNTGTKNMGCQKAGLFLSKAISKENLDKFLHWDIAGPAFVEKPFGHNPVGATGFGVRTILNFLKV